MEDMQRENSLAEVAAVAPMLNQILADSTLHQSRARPSGANLGQGGNRPTL